MLPSKRLLWLAAALSRSGEPSFPARSIAGPAPLELFHRLPRVTEPSGDLRGTVALLSGCVQDRWFRDVNRATIRVLARNGWRSSFRGQRCCGALAAHHGGLDTARALAERNLRAFADADVIVVNAAGCGAHLKELGELVSTDEAKRSRRRSAT